MVYSVEILGQIMAHLSKFVVGLGAENATPLTPLTTFTFTPLQMSPVLNGGRILMMTCTTSWPGMKIISSPPSSATSVCFVS
jgi:hypothetical protein